MNLRLALLPIATGCIGCAAIAPAAFADLPPLSPAAVASGTQIVRHYGNEYAIIPAGANAPYRGADHIDNPYYFGSSFDGQGSVGYSYAIARTELTTAAWGEFVNAFAPYWQGDPTDPRLTGRIITRNASGQYTYDPALARTPATWMTWLGAATYCNWLCNGKATGQAAFLTGAYDLRGVNIAAPAPRTVPVPQNLDAPYRLPTVDEWYKAGYYDPNRYATAHGGWWMYPNMLDRPPIQGLPEDGGETSAGQTRLPADYPLNVAGYPFQSPWGLFDISGGATEFLTRSQGVLADGSEYFVSAGTGQYSGSLDFFDQIGIGRGSVGMNFGFSEFGIRLVSTVPSSAAVLPLSMIVFLLRRHR